MRLAVSECAPVVVSNPYLIGKNGRAQHVVREPRGGGWPREDPLGCLADSTANLSTRPSRIRGRFQPDQRLAHGHYYCWAESVGQETVSDSKKRYLLEAFRRRGQYGEIES